MKRIAAVIGAICFLFGGYLLWFEMQKAVPHSGHVYLMAAIMAFGCLLIVPVSVGEGLKQVVVVIGPYLPDIKIGGKRRTDPTEPPVVVAPEIPSSPPMVDGRIEIGEEPRG